MQQINQFFSLIIVSEELKSIEKHKGDPTKYTSIHARLILLRLTNKRIEKIKNQIKTKNLETMENSK